MRTTILDVLQAVSHVAREHGGVKAWGYAPPPRLRLAGGEGAETGVRALEIAIDAVAGAEVDEELLTRELSARLGPPDVRVRRYRGAAEPRTMFRLVTIGRGA